MTLASRLASRARRGAALFDMLMAIAIAGVVIVGAVLLYQSVTASNARAELVQLSRELRGAAERIHTGHATYAGIDMARLCQAAAVPESAIRNPGACTGFVTPLSARPAGDSIAAWPLDLPGGATAKAFQLAFAALDEATCDSLLSGYVGKTQNRSDFLGAAVADAGLDGAANWSARPWAQFSASPLTQANIASLCSRGNGRNTVFLAFR